MAQDSDSTSDWSSRHLWQIKPLQDLFWIALAFALLWLGYYLRSVFIPILIGFGLAYVLNPLLKYTERRWNLARPVTIGLIFAGLSLALLMIVFFVSPIVVGELKTLTTKTPNYVDTLSGKLQSNFDQQWLNELKAIGSRLPQDGIQLAKFAVNNTGSALGMVSDVVASTVYVVVSLFLIPVYFFFFAWHFNPMLERSKEYLPDEHREWITGIFVRMDQAVGAFLRGRLIVVAAMMVMFSLSYWIAGVPYWFLLGLLTGLLSFVPYLAVVGCALAIAVKWIDVSTGAATFHWISVFVYPLLAYGVVQLLEGWLLTPWIQSQSLNMNPVAILIVVLIGGSVGGLYGLLLAIPIAGCTRILCEELLLPKLERWAEDAT